MYTEDSKLKWGKYKNKKLSEVPVSYMMEVFPNKKLEDKDFLEYIERNFDKFKQLSWEEKKGRLAKQNIELVVELPCSKHVYATEKDARIELKRIRDREQDNQHKPLRVYECEKCSYWHLTSRPDPRF